MQFGLGKRKKVDLIPGSVPTIKYPQNIPESAESASVSGEPSVTSCSGTDNSNTLVIPTQNISDSRYSSSNIPVSSDGRTGSTTVASTVIDTVPAEFIPPRKKVRLSSERQVRKKVSRLSLNFVWWAGGLKQRIYFYYSIAQKIFHVYFSMIKTLITSAV